VLRLLRAHGVDVVAVADLDQSIYEFRRAALSEVRHFASELPTGTRLDGNFRSSPAICALNRSLRVSDDLDVARGRHAVEGLPIHLLSFQAEDQVMGAVEPMLAAAGIGRANVRVLAHKTSDARRTAGATEESYLGSKKVLQFASAALVLNAPNSDSRTRRKAITMAERALVELVQYPEADNQPTEAIAQALGLDGRWLRAAAMRLCCGGDPLHLTRSVYAEVLREAARTLGWPSVVALKDLSAQLKAATGSEWSNLGLEQTNGSFPWGTVHSAKGREHDAVVVVIPEHLTRDAHNRTVLDVWEQGLDSEARRVLYVAASRARRLLVLAVHASHVERINTLLANTNVPFVVTSHRP
jgi:hypothetical protein